MSMPQSPPIAPSPAQTYEPGSVRPIEMMGVLRVMANRLPVWNAVVQQQPDGAVPVAIVIPPLEAPAVAYAARTRELAAAQQLLGAAKFARATILANASDGPCKDLALKRLDTAIAAAEGEACDARR